MLDDQLDVELDDLEPINEDQISSLINNRFDALEKVRTKSVEATKKADEALASAKAVAKRGAGFFESKKTIEGLQAVSIDLAEAQVSTADAQTVSFEYQKLLTEISKFLLGLGVSNLAANRCVVRELELKLQGASQEELDDLARKELMGVVKQLKDQEDIMIKQQELSKKVKNCVSTITELKVKAEEYTAFKIRQAEINQNVAGIVGDFDSRITAIEKTEDDQNEKWRCQADNNKSLDSLIKAANEQTKTIGKELKHQISKNAEYADKIRDLESKVNSLECDCKRLRFARCAAIISAVVGASGLITAIIGFFI